MNPTESLSSRPGPWRFWIDQGGTFTDLVGQDGSGELHLEKLLSKAPERYRHAPIQGIRNLLGLAPEEPIPEGAVQEVRMGTTLATNALLERTGARFAFLTTAGLEDLLEIGYQERPELFALSIEKPELLFEVTLGIAERRDAQGRVLVPLDLNQVSETLDHLKAQGFEGIAVAFLHAHLDPTHEAQVLALAEKKGFRHRVASHQITREARLVPRGDTTCVDAYLSPLLLEYLEDLRQELPEGTPISFMQSSGMLARADQFRGKDAVLSGPAGGLIALEHLGARTGHPKWIGFDMGGTSTDVSLLDGDLPKAYETQVAGVRLKSPMLEIRTVAAGGGSLLRYHQDRFLVGPESAGADPGPACYRRQGPLAVTDANLLLGRIRPEFFPRCFGPDGNLPLDPEASREAFEALAEEVRPPGQGKLSPEEVAAGFRRVANEAMARPVRELALGRGLDLREFTLFAFGGAAAQHACGVSDCLGVKRIVLHPFSGVLSAFGMGLGEVGLEKAQAFLERLPEPGSRQALVRGFESLERRAKAELGANLSPGTELRVRRRVDLRLEGTDQSLTLDASDLDDLEDRFSDEHLTRFGFFPDETPIEVENLRVEVSLPRPSPLGDPEPEGEPQPASPFLEAPIFFESPHGVEELSTPIFRRDQLSSGSTLEGPALILDPVSTIVVDPGWSLRVLPEGVFELERRSLEERSQGASPEGPSSSPKSELSPEGPVDPILLELYQSRFHSAAEQMGKALELSAHSTNIKERLDFSCAVFNGQGELLANAPHIPVHLGAMSATVREIRATLGDKLAPGQVFASNDPFHGGSHLPDITVVRPVFVEDELAFWVANRGHHADIGGITPGSMPPFSRSIDEEGIRFHAFPLLANGKLDEAGIRTLLTDSAYPARNLGQRFSDLKAQIAANETGARILGGYVARYGLPEIQVAMAWILDNGALAVREALAQLPRKTRTFFDHLDDGARIQCSLTPTEAGAVLDFAGTSPQLASNLNAPRAVVEAATLYVLRCLAGGDFPLNAGCLRPVELRIPEGSLLDPSPPAAVVGGNVETSQRVVDVLFGAFGKLAASQGTMNNFTFGNQDYGYYETICGGAGAGMGFAGASAVHTHMTNTRITDPEVLEARYPVRLEAFRVRRGSGGKGTYPGGDGVVRRLRFLEPMQVALLSERRGLPPFGLFGGEPGALGRNLLLRNQDVVHLPGKVEVSVEAGDQIEIQTPGGGGYNPSPEDFATMVPSQARALARARRLDRPTCGISQGFVQANLIVLPAEAAEDFQLFCLENRQACPLLEVIPEGQWRSAILAPGADLRSDLPRYRIYTPEGMKEVPDLWEIADQEAVGFLLGCSFTFEGALEREGFRLRHIEEGSNVPMYRTIRKNVAVGPFGGKLVVSMRPFPSEDMAEIRAITGRFSRAHGAPVHVWDPDMLGIAQLDRPDFGDPVSIREGEIPYFWACGVTSQEACVSALEAGAIPWFASHAPGHMLITDLPETDLEDRP